jgi:hypothetical protein
MEPKFFCFSSVEICHVVILNPSTASKIRYIFGRDIAFVSDVYEFEEVDEVKIIEFGKILA